MKEKKKFFDNNCLNKGYKKLSISSQDSYTSLIKKYQHLLPPVEILEYYEELNPGSIEKLLDMAQKEQHHRHDVHLMSINMKNKSQALGRIFFLLLVIVIAITSLVLVLLGSVVVAAVFSFAAFICLTIISYFCSVSNCLHKKYKNTNTSKAKTFKNSKKNIVKNINV